MRQKGLKKKEMNTNYYLLLSGGMSEEDCLNYCYEQGFYWTENNIRLYEILKRVSCWCCGNKNKKELLNMAKYLPEYIEKRKAIKNLIITKNKKGPVVDNAMKF